MVTNGRHDAAMRRRSQRRGRERGVWVYIPNEALVAAGIDCGAPPPFYRTWPGRRGSIMLRLYGER